LAATAINGIAATAKNNKKTPHRRQPASAGFRL
jgi:hypothetical protein